MKRTITLCLMPVFALALFAQGPRGGGFEGWGGRGPGVLGAGPGVRAPVTGAPYSATETVTIQQVLSNGNQISRTKISNVARDSAGRFSTTETITPPASSGKAPYTIQTIFDPVAGYRYVLDSSTMIARQETLPKPRTGTPPARPTPPANPNVTTTPLPGSSANGVPATGTQITETIPAGAIGNAQPIQITRITWIATTLQVPVQIKTSDPRFGTTDMELTNITTADPGPLLFTVPNSYTIKQGGRGPGGFGGPGGPGGRAAGARRGPPPVQ
jgi:hypothetical protein